MGRARKKARPYFFDHVPFEVRYRGVAVGDEDGADDSAVFNQIRPLLARQMDAVLAQMPDAATRAKMEPDIQEFQKQLAGWITKLLDYQKFKPAFIKIYDETFSAEEIQGLLAFYKSPAGRAFVDKLPVVMEHSAAAIQPIAVEAIPELPKMTDAWVEKMKAKYQKASRSNYPSPIWATAARPSTP